MKVDLNGKNFIKNSEGLASKSKTKIQLCGQNEPDSTLLYPYRCSAGVPTIGYGTTRYPNGVKVSMNDKPITKAQADEYFEKDLMPFEKDLNSLINGLNLNQNQYNALLSFGYNLGMDIDLDNIPEGLGDSTLLKKIKANKNDPSIKDEFLKWNKVSGVANKGITERRKREAELFFK